MEHYSFRRCLHIVFQGKSSLSGPSKLRPTKDLLREIIPHSYLSALVMSGSEKNGNDDPDPLYTIEQHQKERYGLDRISPASVDLPDPGLTYFGCLPPVTEQEKRE